MKKVFVSLAILATMSSANAWGDREQGALLGLIIGGALVKNQQDQVQVVPVQPQQVIVLPPVYQQPPVFVPPPKTQTCLQHPYYDQYGRLLGYQISCH